MSRAAHAQRFDAPLLPLINAQEKAPASGRVQTGHESEVLCVHTEYMFLEKRHDRRVLENSFMLLLSGEYFQFLITSILQWHDS